MTPVAEHKCNLLPEGILINKFYDSDWCLDIYEERLCGISFCLYCGERLETDKEKWIKEKENINQE